MPASPAVSRFPATPLLLAQPSVTCCYYYYPGSNSTAYVFRRIGGSWQQEANLNPSGEVVGAGAFGHSVAISANRIVIGAPATDTFNVRKI